MSQERHKRCSNNIFPEEKSSPHVESQILGQASRPTECKNQARFEREFAVFRAGKPNSPPTADTALRATRLSGVAAPQRPCCLTGCLPIIPPDSCTDASAHHAQHRLRLSCASLPQLSRWATTIFRGVIQVIQRKIHSAGN